MVARGGSCVVMPSATLPATASISAVRVRIAWPSLVETALAVVAVAVIFPWFARFGIDESGRDQRFADASAEMRPARSPTLSEMGRRIASAFEKPTEDVGTSRADLQSQTREGAEEPLSSGSVDATIPDTPAGKLVRAKNAAMRDLLVTAGWQWGAWMLAGLVLGKLAGTRLPAAAGVSLALATWALAAWAGRVPWPLAHDRMFELGRVDTRWDAMPAGFVIALFVAAGILLALSAWLRKPLVPVPQTLSSRVGYPGFIVATGIGWLLLLDLSANGNPGNRYLPLYHHGHLWLAMLVLTVVAFLRPGIGRALAWLLSALEELGGRVGRLLGPLLAPAAIVLVMLVIVGAVGALLSGIRQLTSELGRVWLIFGVAWFFFLRGAPVAERMARSATPLVPLVRYAWPLAFVAFVLVGAILVLRDMGPLLIASYAAGAFLAASIAMWWHVRTGARYAPAGLAACAFAAWIAIVTVAVFQFGAVHEVTAGRLENLAAPLASANDQLALVTWFPEAAPPDGFGFGAAP